MSDSLKTSMLSFALLGAVFYGLVKGLGFESTISNIGSQFVQLATHLISRLL